MDNFWNDDTVKAFVQFYNSHNDWIDGIDPIKKKINEFKERKQPKPLFTTKDGKNIFPQDEYYSVSDNFELFWNKAPYHLPDNMNYVNRCFSTKEAAEQYILDNKPCLSLKDVLSIPCGYTCDIRSELTKLVQSKLKS